MTTPAAIRILIVDGHERVRLGLITALAIVDDVAVAGEAATGAEALRLCAGLDPDVVLTEMRLPDLEGEAFIRDLRHRFPWTQVVVLTSGSDAALQARAMAAGAHGYLQKYVGTDELVRVIRTAHGAGRTTPAMQRGGQG